MNKTDIQYEMLKAEFEMTQRQMDKYDSLSTTVKTWAATLWAASIGWAFQVHSRSIFLVSAAIVILFWFFDAMNKNFRSGYKRRRDEVARVLAMVFETGEVPVGTKSPKLPDSMTELFKNTLRAIFMIHISLPYVVLILIALFLFLKGGIN